MPIGAIVRVPEDLIAFAELIVLVTNYGFEWRMTLADSGVNTTDEIGTDVDSLRVLLHTLQDLPLGCQISGHRRAQQLRPGVSDFVGYVCLTFGWSTSITVTGDDLDWVAGTRERLEAETRRRFRAAKIPWWRRHAAVVAWVPALIGGVTVEVVLLAVVRTESVVAVGMAIAVASLGGVVYERLRLRPFPSIKFVLSSADTSPPKSWTQNGFFEFLLAVGPIAPILSALIAGTALILVVSDRCTASKTLSPPSGTTVPANVGVAPPLPATPTTPTGP